MIRRYTPVFDTSSLTGDRDKDLAWVRRHFGGYLQPAAGAFEGNSVPAGLRSASRRRSNSKNERLSDADYASRAYALSLIVGAGKGPLVSNIIAAIVLARTIERTRVTLAAVTRAAAMPAPVIAALHAPIIGFEPAIRRLIEVPGFVPGGDLKGLDGEYVYDDMTIARGRRPGRTYVLLLGHLCVAWQAAICSGGSSTRCGVTTPSFAICEDAKGIPDEISIAADINLIGGRLDYPFLPLMLEAVYGQSGRVPLDRWTNAYDVHYLTIDDIVLAFRPGRSASEVVAILASLTERNRIAARDGDNDDDESDGSSSGSKTSKQKAGQGEPRQVRLGARQQQRGWRPDKPSGAEVIQPEPWAEDGSPPSLRSKRSPYTAKPKPGRSI